MDRIPLHLAKAQLSKLVAEVRAGESFIITVRDEPVARLVAIEAPVVDRTPGRFKGEFVVPDDFNDPMPDDELDAWENG